MTDTTDLIARLRNADCLDREWELFQEAADEIERAAKNVLRLTGDLARMQGRAEAAEARADALAGALQEMVDHENDPGWDELSYSEHARAAIRTFTEPRHE